MTLSRQLEIKSSRAGNAPMHWRGICEYQDLRIDFQNPDRVELAVQLLQTCLLAPSVPQGDDAVIWHLTLSGRIGALIAVYIMTFDRSELEMLHQCGSTDCAKMFETQLPLERLLEMARQAEQTPVLDIDIDDGETVRIRRPTGASQKQWRDRQYKNKNEAVQYMLSTLLTDDRTISNHQRTPLIQALEEHDPLVSFQLLSHCPLCGREMVIPVDLEALILGELRKAQTNLLKDVHIIASQYGWTEQEILSIPAGRRRSYIEQIQSGSMQ